MGKYQQLINSLFKQGKYQQSIYDDLLNANHHAFKPLTASLLNHPDEDIREICAEILGDRDSTKAIPFLIEALLDKSLYVRQDALWSIARISGYQPGALECWLNITNMDKPQKLHNRVSKWWKLNKHYIQRM